MYVGNLLMKPTVSESNTFFPSSGSNARVVVVSVVKRLGDSSFVSVTNRLNKVVFPLLV